jgi:hypothetical protein
MALIEINRDPSRRELRVFAGILLVFFGLAGALVLYWTGRATLPSWLWGIGTALSAAGLLFPKFMREVYLGWMMLAFPIGWLVSHLVLGATYFLVLTPIAVVIRVLVRDPLERRFEASRKSYWVGYPLPDTLERYFRQH